MKNIFRLLFAALLIVAAVIPGKAEVYRFEDGAKGNRGLKQTTAGCSPSSAFEWLDINNVKTRINAGGDMWWDLPSGTGSKYFIPANGAATSLFAGSLWIAGVDVNNQLKCAALRFRQVGNDYWTGPLTIDGSAAISDVTCAQWDKIYKITRAEVDDFLSHFGPDGKKDDNYSIPKIISEWPAHPDVMNKEPGVKLSHYGAPFFDRNNNGEYEPEQGDYPYYDLNNELCHTKIETMDEAKEGSVHGSILADQVLKGDQTLWWIFNDKGSSHTESSGEAIGIEVRAQAFGFATNDEINNMTFYSYEIINRSTYTLTGTYFSPWTDVDLGYGWDDFVGCDVSRGLGYGYNGAPTDGNGQPEAYGAQPPAIGVDFFQGPYMDPDGVDNPKYSYTYVQHIVFNEETQQNDTIYEPTNPQQLCDESINGVNFGNGIVDDERFGMRRFVYHDNSNAPNGDPDKAPQYYNMLRGIWKDGNKMKYGGNAYSGSDVVGPECDFMFPGDTDPWNWGTGCQYPNGGYNQNGKYWTEETCHNSPNDRRFMQSAGPFTLLPGAVNYITFGVPWARATSGGPWASVELLRVVDDKCQALFDNCFKVIDGPTAPDLTIRELDQQLIVYISNSTTSNNYKERYIERDPEIPEYIDLDTLTRIECDQMYRFEGYKVYQLVNDKVSPDELYNTDKARLVFQCDIKNGVTRMVNYEYDNYIQANVPSLMVEGGDAGITHSFVITNDLFSNSDNPTLVNHKTYYYMAVAYAYNNYYTYSQEPGDIGGLYGQMKPYLEGRKNIQCYSAIPHKIVNGTILNSTYGESPAVRRIVGVGNGGNEVELDPATVDSILFKDDMVTPKMAIKNQVRFGDPDYPVAYHPTYSVGKSPINVKIIDPLNVKTNDYELTFDSLVEVYTYGVVDDPSIHLREWDSSKADTNTYVKGNRAPRKVSYWTLTNLTDPDDTIPYRSDTTTAYTDERMFIDKGISIAITQPYEMGPLKVGYYYDLDQNNPDNSWHEAYRIVEKNNAFITSSIEFKDESNPWLDGIRDKDVPGTIINWIRAGNYIDQEDNTNSDYNTIANKPYDPDQLYESVAHGTWSPYILGSFSGQGGKWNPGPVYMANSREDSYFTRTSSVDIVFTADKSKWTRCPVIEMCMDNKLAEGGAKRFFLRKHASVDKEGNPTTIDWTTHPDSCSMNPEDANFIAAQGMGWFPGYVIDVETGARLNLAFGEDSYLDDQNGRDMLFNPTKLLKNTVNEVYGESSQLLDPNIIRNTGIDEDPVMGGKHFVYIWGMDKNPSIPATAPYKEFDCPAYDGGKYLFDAMNYFQNSNLGANLNVYLYRQVMWIGMPMGIEGSKWILDEGFASENDPEGNVCRIRIRVTKPYKAGYGYTDLDTLRPELNINNLNPQYKFSIKGLDPVYNDPEKTQTDLDLVTVVPNPYYAYDEYETNALMNKVKITNLPDQCVVTIYTISGTKVRQFKKDSAQTFLEWDLTNFANTPVASGFYLIHVKDYKSGDDRVIKFFAAMRQVDLNTF